MRISDWSSDVCSSDLLFQLTVVEATHLIRGVGGRIVPRTEEVLHSELKRLLVLGRAFKGLAGLLVLRDLLVQLVQELTAGQVDSPGVGSHALGPSNERAVRIELQVRSEEHTSELQSLMRNSYAVFCLKNN